MRLSYCNPRTDPFLPSVFNDLGSGVSYGVFGINLLGEYPGLVLEFPLNANALFDINKSAGGLFAIGGDVLNGGSFSDRSLFRRFLVQRHTEACP